MRKGTNRFWLIDAHAPLLGLIYTLHVAASRCRISEHGPRRYRWPDGSLQETKPPPNPYAVANRRKWAQLVEHCRTHGGDRTFEKTGRSLRHGLNVSRQQHVAFLKEAGLEPETDAQGQYIGFDPEKTKPLKDPAHPFNSFYKEAAEEIFKERRGRLL